MSPLQQLAAAFPPGFVFGAATAAFQIEGSWARDGKGESVWDRFLHDRGDRRGDTACDSYRLWQADVDLCASLGLGAYRFSVSWPRILPDGRGRVEPRGLDHYDRVVDGLCQAGIAPVVTLFHWDTPQALQDRGGWVERDTAAAFADYADVVSRRLGDRVSCWLTINEPQVVTALGHLRGTHAPGLRDVASATAAAHHLLLGHGLAVGVLRANSRRARVGAAWALNPQEPATPAAEDLAAAEWADLVAMRWLLDPLAGRGYPDDALTWLGAAGPPVRDGDLQTAAAPLDLLGVNYYQPGVVSAEHPLDLSGGSAPHPLDPEAERTGLGFAVRPDALESLLLRPHRDYDFPELWVTENGAVYPDTASTDGVVEDLDRLSFLRRHLEVGARCIAAGVPLTGWLVWSLLDNLEWDLGFGPRFGLASRDPVTQERTPKASGRWYGTLIDAHRQVHQ